MHKHERNARIWLAVCSAGQAWLPSDLEPRNSGNVDWQKLYMDLVLRWNRDQRYRGVLAAPTHVANGDNPLCGDHLQLMLQVHEQQIQAASFAGEMSAITTASAAMMCDLLQGRRVSDAQFLIASALAMLNEGGAPDASLADFAAFEIVRNYPNRIKTATLPWATAKAALAGQANATTE